MKAKLFQSIFHKIIVLCRICLREKYVIYKWNEMLNLNVQDTLDIKKKHFTTNIPNNRKNFKYSIKLIYPEARKKPVQLLYHTNTVTCNKRNQSCHSTVANNLNDLPGLLTGHRRKSQISRDFLTEVIICSFNNNTLQKWTNGKAFNIIASAQFFTTQSDVCTF